ncbi:WD domain-containing protein [Aspergillus eucalypticola CBS 122712]|uniref:WD domain-containing protein n=1 Tax=Aspergillus eucalypticola (strain CBS 122712 / IBT 29274) TaxID=1448314 RepID=A0A317W152_ASPEC|nr:WD domain-containing protein [Aspergillus eucalypticola CBS 122712]PWY78992.1 WD domain-containing protein [Aspergillus eucalypticola CBS 122712]
MTCKETLKGIFKPSTWKKRNKADKEVEPSSSPASSALRQEPQYGHQPASTVQAPPDESNFHCFPQSESKDIDHEISHDEGNEMEDMEEMTDKKETTDKKAMAGKEEAFTELPSTVEQEELNHRLHDKTLRNGLWEAASRKVEQEVNKNVMAQFVKLLVEAEISQDEEGTSNGDANERGYEGNLEKLQHIVKGKLDVIQNARLVVRGQVVRDKAFEIFGTIKIFKDIITATVSAEPHAALAWGCVAGFFPLLDNAFTQFGTAKTGLKNISDILVRCRLIEATNLISRDQSSEDQELLSRVKDKMIDLYSQFLKYQISVVAQYSRPFIKRLLRDAVLIDNWEVMYKTMNAIEESISRDLARISQKTVETIKDEFSRLRENVALILDESRNSHEEIKLLTQDALISGLPEAKYAAFDTYRKDMPPPSYCHEDTRKQILREIQRWGNGGDDNCIFWLRGMAGTGKSTIARTVAKMFDDQLLLGASFFFSRSNADRADPDRLFPTLARQLADVLPGFAAHLKDSIQDKHDMAQQSLDQQWRGFILEPLSALSDKFSHSMVLVLVIDALDECQNGRIYAQSIVKLLATARTLEKVQLRIFVTSRPEYYLVDGFTKIPSTTYYDVKIDDSGDVTTERDIRIFLEDKVSEIATRKQPNNGSPEAWPGKERTEKLIERCGRLFIAAATACRLLETTGFLDDTLDSLLNTNKQHVSLTKDIDEMYKFVLKQAITERDLDSELLIPLFRLVVGSIITMPEALSLRNLATLLRKSCGTIRTMLKDLKSVLVVPEEDDEQVSIFHLSFRDFLVDPNRCDDERLIIDEKKANKKLFNRCMDLLLEKDYLRRNICDIRQPGTAAVEISQETVNNYLPQEVQYACWHWGTHITCAASIQTREATQLLKFLKEHFTHWLEALSLTRRMSHASPTMTELKSRFAPGDYPELFEFVDDGRQFINHHGIDISEAPLQVYYSALVFSPSSSVLRRQYQKESPRWINLASTTHSSWGQAERILRCGEPRCTTFSPDSTKVAAGTLFGQVMVWNLITGELEQLLQKNDARPGQQEVLGVSFYPNCRKLKAVYRDLTVNTFNIITGQLEQRENTPVGVTDIAAIRPLPDSMKVAFLTKHSQAVCLWDSEIGETRIIDGQFEKWILSPNGELIASCSDGRIKLSKIILRDTGVCDTEDIFAWEVKSDLWFHVAFSSDLKRIALRIHHDEVQVWDMDGEPEVVVEHKSCYVEDMTFSPDCTQLAVSTNAGTLEIWDLSTRQIIYCLGGHSEEVGSITFSPDGRKLASFTNNAQAVRIWDLHGLRKVDQPPGSPIDTYGSIFTSIVSPSGQTAIFTRYGKDSEVWDLASGKVQHTLTENIGRSGAFSPDNDYLAFINRDGFFKLLSTTTWKPNLVLESPFSMALAFSLDSRRVVLLGNDGILRVCDSATGREEQASPKRLPGSELLAFSPNGDMVASSSANVMTIWSFGKEPIQYDIDIGRVRITALAFSHSGKQIAIGCRKGYVKICDLRTGEVFTKHTGHSTSVQSLTFAPDDTRLAARDVDSILIWDMAKERPIKESPCYNDSSISTRQPLLLNWKDLAVYTFEEDLKWVTYNEKKIVAIPAHFRPHSIELLSASSLVLIGKSSVIGILHFPPEPDYADI